MKTVWMLFVGILTVLPSIVLAEEIPEELVPCGDRDQSLCQTCHVYQLVENVFAWIFGMASIIVTIVIVLGGLRLVTSRGNQVAMRDTRKIISSAVIGFALIMSAWILVDLLIAFLSGTPDSGSIFGSIECVEQSTPQ